MLDVTRLRETGWKPSIDLDTGIRRTYEWFLDEHAASHTLRGIAAEPAVSSAR
jgi:GDP-L-fucose synthase